MTTTTETTATTTQGKGNAVSKAPAKRTTAKPGTTAKVPTKAQQAETTKALSAAQRKSLDALVESVKVGMAKALEADRQADTLRITADSLKVLTARAIVKLNGHPAVTATTGPKTGSMAITKVSTLTDIPAMTLQPVFRAAEEFIKRGWAKRTGEPTAEELAIVRGFVASENDARYSRELAKGKGKGTTGKGKAAPVTKGTKITFEALQGQLAAFRESLERFTKDYGFTNAQADDLATGLDAAHDLIEKATTKSAA